MAKPFDLDNGFFFPNERKEYNAGLNDRIKPPDDGSINIHNAAQKPDGVPNGIWIPIPQEDLDLKPQSRAFLPDLEADKTWQAPVAEMVD